MENPSSRASLTLVFTRLRQSHFHTHRISTILSPKCLLTPSLLFADEQSQTIIKHISRRNGHGFNLIPSHVIHDEHDSNKRDGSSSRDARVCYTLPILAAPQLFLTQRVDNCPDLSDFEICNRYNIDNTGLVCNWPSEDVLAHYCLSHADMFRSKKVIELGSGYGLAGFAIAAATEASEVVISDGNPQRNIEANSGAFGDTVVKSMTLHWNQDNTSDVADTFDIIIARSSEAIFLSPKRGNSLDLFLEVAKENGLHFSVTENYDKEVWKRHEGFLNEDRDSWPSYEKDIPLGPLSVANPLGHSDKKKKENEIMYVHNTGFLAVTEATISINFHLLLCRLDLT
ncbi:Calmodulin-lysine N-methyltransferase, partial [Mucuna pruriens]